MIGGYFALALMLLVLGIVTCAAVVAGMAIAVLKPPRMTDGKAVWVLGRLSPGDLGLGFEDVAFAIRDERTGTPMRIAGWWIPRAEARGRCALLLHGYADAKVGAIGWAPLWQVLNYNILAIDLRAHGQSDGVYSTGGFWERHDVGQVIDQLRAQRPADAQKIVLVGVNLGAAVAAALAAMRDDVSAIVLVDPPADFREGAMAEMDRGAAPGRLIQSYALRLSERIAGCDFSAVRPIELIRTIQCPIMMIMTSGESQDDPAQLSLQQVIQARHRNDDMYFPLATQQAATPVGNSTDCEMRLRTFLGKTCD